MNAGLGRPGCLPVTSSNAPAISRNTGNCIRSVSPSVLGPVLKTQPAHSSPQNASGGATAATSAGDHPDGGLGSLRATTLPNPQ